MSVPVRYFCPRCGRRTYADPTKTETGVLRHVWSGLVACEPRR